MDGTQDKPLRSGFAMARGSGADADVVARHGGRKPRQLVRGVLGLVVLIALVFWVFQRGDDTPLEVPGGAIHAEATGVEIDPGAGRVLVDFAPPDGCWVVDEDASSVVVEPDQLVVDLRLQWAEEGCSRSHTFSVPAWTGARADEVPVTQVACGSGALACGEPLVATVTGAR